MKEQIIALLDGGIRNPNQAVISFHQGVFRIVIQRKDGL